MGRAPWRITNMPWFPWLLHVTGLRGTVSGCVPLPGLSLEVQPSNLHVNTYGYMTEGTDNCASSPSVCSVGAHSSATFDFTGIADPGQTNLPVFFAGQDDGANAAGATTLHYQTTPAAGLEVGTPGVHRAVPVSRDRSGEAGESGGRITSWCEAEARHLRRLRHRHEHDRFDCHLDHGGGERRFHLRPIDARTVRLARVTPAPTPSHSRAAALGSFRKSRSSR